MHSDGAWQWLGALTEGEPGAPLQKIMLLVHCQGGSHTTTAMAWWGWSAMSGQCVWLWQSGQVSAQGTLALAVYRLQMSAQGTLYIALGGDEVQVLSPAGGCGAEDDECSAKQKGRASGLLQPEPAALWQIHLWGE